MARTAVDVVFGAHSLERFAERVRPSLKFRFAVEELERLADQARVSAEPPAWLRVFGKSRHSPLWLTAGDVTFPLAPEPGGQQLRATTCLCPGLLLPGVREHRNAARRGLI